MKKSEKTITSKWLRNISRRPATHTITRFERRGNPEYPHCIVVFPTPENDALVYCVSISGDIQNQACYRATIRSELIRLLRTANAIIPNEHL